MAWRLSRITRHPLLKYVRRSLWLSIPPFADLSSLYRHSTTELTTLCPRTAIFQSRSPLLPSLRNGSISTIHLSSFEVASLPPWDTMPLLIRLTYVHDFLRLSAYYFCVVNLKDDIPFCNAKAGCFIQPS